jgi:hypothetical protein
MKNILEIYGDDTKKLNKVLTSLRKKNYNDPQKTFEFSNKDVSFKNFRDVDFSNLTIRACHIEHCKMINCKYAMGFLIFSKIQYNQFIKTKYDGLYIENVTFNDCKFYYTDFTNSIFLNVYFIDCEFENVNFDVQNTEGVIFKNCSFSGCYNMHKLPEALACLIEKDCHVTSAYLSKYVKNLAIPEYLSPFLAKCPKEEIQKLVFRWNESTKLKDWHKIARFFDMYIKYIAPFYIFIPQTIESEESRKIFLNHFKDYYNKEHSDFYDVYVFKYKSNRLSIEDKNNLIDFKIKEILVVHVADAHFDEEVIWKNFESIEDFMAGIKYEKLTRTLQFVKDTF